MKITRNSIETTAGPSEWFTGAVFVDTVAAPLDASRLSASSVHFTPRRTYRLAHASEWADDLGHRGPGPLPVPRPPDRGDPTR